MEEGNTTPQPPAPIARYCIYARKSMEAEERQALSIESQLKEMRLIARRNELKIVAVREEAHSAKLSGSRPVFNQMIQELKAGTYNAILTWAPDRLSRNAGDLGMLVDLMDQEKLISIRTFNQTFTNSPNEKFLLMILCSQAKFENDNKAINVKRGLRMSVSKGFWPTGTPIGYRSLKRTDRPGELELDKERAPIVKEMFEKVAYEGWSQHRVRNYLEDSGVRSVNGNVIGLSSVQLMLHRHFYYGRFEYPVGSGKWYKGKHPTIITKEVFDLAQEEMLKHNTRRWGKSYIYEPYNFLRLMRCGSCGSGVCARDVQKYRITTKDLSHFRYYMCSNAATRRCKELYINEKDLIVQLAELLDKVDLDFIALREQYEASVHRFYRLNSFVTGESFVERTHEKRDEDLRKWMKIIFDDGTPEEQRSVLNKLKSRILLKDKHIYLDESAVAKTVREEPRVIGIEIRTISRGLACRIYESTTVHPGQMLNIAGGARLVFEEETHSKKGDVTFAFRVEELDEHAARMFGTWLNNALRPSINSIKWVSVNETKAKHGMLPETILDAYRQLQKL